MIKRLFRVLGLLILVLAGACAKATPTYQFVWAGGGDVTGLTAINNLGQVLFTSGQFCGGGCSYINNIRGPGGFQTFNGLPTTGFPQGTSEGTFIHSFNSAGDMVGTSRMPGGDRPTFWRGGVAYDLTDPANAHLVFVPDVGVGGGELYLSDLSSSIVNLDEILRFEPGLDQDLFLTTRRHAKYNSRGDYAFMIGELRDTTAYLLRLSVPVPPTAPLIGVALFALALTTRCQRGG